jgi:hypothetical protein
VMAADATGDSLLFSMMETSGIDRTRRVVEMDAAGTVVRNYYEVPFDTSGAAGIQAGSSFALGFAGTTVVVGDANAAKVTQFSRAGNPGGIVRTLNGSLGSGFGAHVAVTENNIVVGGFGSAATFGANTSSGTTPIDTIAAPAGGGDFAAQVGALSGDRVVISDPLADDFDGLLYVYNLTVLDANSPPVAEAGTYAAVNENGVIVLDASGSTDPDNDALTYAWDLDNDGEYDDATGLTVNFSKDLPGSYTIGLEVSDGTLTSTDSVVLTFNDVAPTANAGLAQSVVRQQTVTLTGTGASSTDGPVSYAWDFSYDGVTFNAEASTQNASTSYAIDGTFTVALRVTDNDDQAVIHTAVITVGVAELQGNDLYVGGTNAGETIEVRRDTGTGPRVYINGLLIGAFNFSGKAVIFGGDGNDNLSVASDITNAAHIFGGSGDDTITGGGGDDMLFGESGNDLITARGGNDVAVGGADNDSIFGGKGRDVLIGGLGADYVDGDADDDILIASFTSHDANTADLASIRSTWTSGSSYAARVSALQAGPLSTASVSDDNAIDTVRGGSGQDWFLVQEDGTFRDILDDIKKTEIATDVL